MNFTSDTRARSPNSILHEAAQAVGLEIFAYLSRTDVLLALLPDEPRLAAWQEKGFAADLSYMKRPPALFVNPDNLLSQFTSAVVFIVRYSGTRFDKLDTPKSHGLVARYAWGRDYHRVLKARLKRFVGIVSEHIGRPIAWRGFSDAVPLLERALARGAGVGFVGNNSLLITPGTGSYTFICEVVWDFPWESEHGPVVEDQFARVRKASCGSCVRCMPACPTNAIVSPRVLDAGKCISYLTIEKRGVFSDSESRAIGRWVFGCDVCQEVCPFNVAAEANPPLHEFLPESGAGRTLDLISLLALKSQDAFVKRFGGTALMRTGREGLLRNACAVIRNASFLEGTAALCDAAQDDPSMVVRTQAANSLESMVPSLDGRDRMIAREALQRYRSNALRST